MHTESGRNAGIVIRTVWETIAETGNVPGNADTGTVEDRIEGFRALRKRTPQSPHLVEMTPKKLKEELERRDN